MPKPVKPITNYANDGQGYASVSLKQRRNGERKEKRRGSQRWKAWEFYTGEGGGEGKKEKRRNSQKKRRKKMEELAEGMETAYQNR